MSAPVTPSAALRVLASTMATLRDVVGAQERALLAIADALDAGHVLAAPAAVTPPLVDKREVARLLGVSVATVDRLDRAGQPHVRVGDARRYQIDDVLAWHRARTESASQASPPGAEPVPQATPPVSGVRLLSRRRRAAR